MSPSAPFAHSAGPYLADTFALLSLSQKGLADGLNERGHQVWPWGSISAPTR